MRDLLCGIFGGGVYVTPEEAIKISILARKRAKEMIEESGEKPTSYAEYLGLVVQCQNDLIQEASNEQDES